MPIETPLFLLAIFLPLLCSPLFFWLPKGCKPYLGWIGSTIPFTSALLLYYSVFSQDEEIKHIVAIASYFSPLHLQLSFLADGLSLFFAFLVTLMGGLVFIYANDYMLKEEEEGSLSVFYAALSAFITFMLGALLSNDLLLQFTFWELTGACSFLLIGYHYHHSKAIQAAKGAFLLTSFADLGLLAGLILLGLSAGTFSWEEILIKNSEGFALPLKELTFLLLFMGIIGKSAQFPFHFWLPGAMCAPTPVSSYLHAATMVKLGVFLTARISPLFSSLELWFPLLTILCFSTMILGGIFSLLSHDLKAILAWATVSQLGFFIGFYGLENPHSVSKEFIHILNHALYKGALFMLVGIVSYSTKERDVRRLGGLFSLLPLTGVAFLIACASMAGIPGTTGFISKELIVSELLYILEGKTLFSLIFGVFALGSLFKVALAFRLFFHLFIREGKKTPNHLVHKPSLSLQISPLLLASLSFLFGVWPAGLEKLLSYFSITNFSSLPEEVKGFHPTILKGLLLSIVILSFGVLLFLGAERVNWSWRGIPHLLNFNRYFQRLQLLLIKAAEKVTNWIEPKQLSYAQAILFISFSFVLFMTLPIDAKYMQLSHDHDPIRFFLSLILIFCCFGVILLKDQISQLISLSISGFLVSLLFILFKAPDLAMTQILVEVVTLFLFLFLLSETGKQKEEDKKKPLLLASSLLFGSAIFLLCSTLYVVDLPHIGTYFSENSLTLADAANTVNSIVINFRGFDTLGESLVLIIACLGILGLLRTRCRYPEITLPLASTDFFPSLSLSKRIGHASRSLLLATYTKPIFFVVNLLAIYLLLRGHNLPGGGFIAGVCTAISLILIGISMKWGKVLGILRVEPLEVASWGLSIMIATTVLPLFFKKPLLFHPKWHLKIADTVALSTQLLFDIGIYMLVSGTLSEILFAFKKRLSMKYVVASSSIKETQT